MPILIQCTSCGQKLRVQVPLLGKLVKCPNCQTKFQATAVTDGSGPTAVAEISQPASAPPLPQPPPPPAPVSPAAPRPFEPPAWTVFAVIGGVLLAVTFIAYGVGALMASAVEQARKPAPNVVEE